MLSEKSNYSHASAADTSGKADELGRKKKPKTTNKPQWSWALPDNQRIHLSSHMLSISKKDMQEQ